MKGGYYEQEEDGLERDEYKAEFGARRRIVDRR